MIERIVLFSRAEKVIGEYGSALYGSIFAPPMARVCALRGGALHPGFLQSGLAAAMGQECGYVFGAAPDEALQFDYAIDPEHLAEGLSLMDVPRRTAAV